MPMARASSALWATTKSDAYGLDVVELSFELANRVEPTDVSMEAVFGAALAVHLGLTVRVDTHIARQRQD